MKVESLNPSRANFEGIESASQIRTEVSDKLHVPSEALCERQTNSRSRIHMIMSWHDLILGGTPNPLGIWCSTWRLVALELVSS